MADNAKETGNNTDVDNHSPVRADITRSIKKTTSSGQGTGVDSIIGQALTQSIKDAMAFESAMADVRKVVKFDTPQQFAQMNRDIVDMSGRLPMTANDIAKIVASGGQAGVAVQGLKEYAETTAKMGIAFNETAEESGQQMAHWRAALKLNQAEAVSLADKISVLSSSGLANAKQISSIVTSMGPLGEVAGKASGEIAALGTTFLGFGVDQQTATTGIKSFVSVLASGSAATAEQKKAFGALGLDPEALSAQMQSDAKGAMLKTLDAIAKLPAPSRKSMMELFFGSDAATDASSLLNNLDQLKVNFNRVSSPSDYGGALQNNYAVKAALTTNKLQRVQNLTDGISIKAGNTMLPLVNDSLDLAAPKLEKLSDWASNNPQGLKGLVSAGIGTMAAGRYGLLAGGLVGSGAYLALNKDEIAEIIESNKEESDAAKKAKSDVAKYNFGKRTEVAPIVYDPFGFNQERKPPDGSIGVIPAGMVNFLPSPIDWSLQEKANALRSDLGAAQGRFPYALTNWSNSPGYHYDAPSLADIDQGGKALLQGEMVVRFENAPSGMHIAESKGSPGLNVKADVGYSPFSPESLMR